MEKPIPKRVAVFASGTGSNAKKIIDYFDQHPTIEIPLIVCNKAGAGVLDIAREAGIDTLIIEKDTFQKTGYLPELKAHGIDFIVLAGFLWKVPAILIHAYPDRIINIHPALLPSFGGKGMYGAAVHQAVIHSGEKKSGITIHFVDEIYDNGAIIFQAECEVVPEDTPGTLAQKIHTLEHVHYSKEIEKLLIGDRK